MKGSRRKPSPRNTKMQRKPSPRNGAKPKAKRSERRPGLSRGFLLSSRSPVMYPFALPPVVWITTLRSGRALVSRHLYHRLPPLPGRQFLCVVRAPRQVPFSFFFRVLACLFQDCKALKNLGGNGTVKNRHQPSAMPSAALRHAAIPGPWTAKPAKFF